MSHRVEEITRALADRYVIERELGSGGMATVLLATDIKHDRKVAVKVLHPELAAGFGDGRFPREIRIVAQFSHPHILALYDSGEAGGLQYYVMPYVEGETLSARLAREKRLSISDAIHVLRDVAEALAYSHARGVIHRDIKPANVMMAGRHALVTDFGIAKAISTATGEHKLTSVGVVVGTPQYMAPEQALGDATIDARCDIYALGLLGFEMLDGRPAFDGTSTASVLKAQIANAPPSLDTRRPETPRALTSLIKRCLEKEPERRPQSAEEILAALETIDTLSGSSTPVEAPRSRRKHYVAGAALTGLAAIVATALALQSGDRELPTIAVVPLDVANADTSLRYLSDGITDEVTTALAQYPTLRVAARGSAYAFRGTTIDAKAAASGLGVDDVLELSIQGRGDSIRISADLVAGKSGIARWSHTAAFPVSRLAAIRDSIVRSVVRVLTPDDRSAIARRRHEPSREALEMYLRGRYATDIGGREDLTRAVAYFRRAREIDTAYAQAYASEATAWTQLADAYLAPDECYPRADTLSRRALAIDSTIAEAHANLAWIDILYVRNWAAGEAKFKRALSFNPNDALTLNYYGQMLYVSGRLAEADTALNASVKLDPNNPWFQMQRVALMAFRGQPDSALSAQRRLDALVPGYVYGESFAADAWRLKGDARRALALDSAASRAMHRPTAGLVLSLVKLGERAAAERAFREMEAVRQTRYMPAEVLGRSAVALGYRDRALEWFRKGVEEHSTWASFTVWFPDMRSFLADAEYQRIVRSMGLPPTILVTASGR